MWPEHEAVREWQEKIRGLLERSGISQREAAECCQVSTHTFEAWLADPDATWHRTPSWLQKHGASYLLYRLSQRLSPHDVADRYTESQWEQVDWSLTDTEIAKLIGVTSTGVNYHRRRRAPETLVSRWDSADWSKSNRELAVLFGVSVNSVWEQRRRRAPDTLQDAKWSSVDWSMSNQEIAERFGVHVQTVRYQRRRRAPEN